MSTPTASKKARKGRKSGADTHATAAAASADAEAPLVLSNEQQRMCDAVRALTTQEDKKLLVLQAHRRMGTTVAIAKACVEYAQEHPGSVQTVVRMPLLPLLPTTNINTLDFVQTIYHKVGYEGPIHYKITCTNVEIAEITLEWAHEKGLRTCSTIRVHATNNGTLKGVGGDVTYFDLGGFRIDEDFFNEVVFPLLGVKGSKVVVINTTGLIEEEKEFLQINDDPHVLHVEIPMPEAE